MQILTFILLAEPFKYKGLVLFTFIYNIESTLFVNLWFVSEDKLNHYLMEKKTESKYPKVEKERPAEMFSVVSIWPNVLRLL